MRIDQFGFTTSDSGWILMGGELFQTSDRGKDWARITPAQGDTSMIQTVASLDGQMWVIQTYQGRDGVTRYEIAISHEGQAGWVVQDLDLFQPEESWIVPQAVHLFFFDDRQGWMTIRYVSSANFNLGTLFKTADGGLTWERLDPPSTGPVIFNSPGVGWMLGGVKGTDVFQSLDGGKTWDLVQQDAVGIPAEFHPGSFTQPPAGSISALDVISENSAIALVSSGECSSESGKTRSSCTTTSSLHITQDRGRTWEIVPLPHQPDGTLESPKLVTSNITMPALVTAFQNTVTVSGQAFDSCEITHLSQMQMWWDSSPYTAVNLYIGGASRACSNANISASYLAQLQQQGWTLIPTWVGPQAPCSTLPNKIPLDPGEAYFLGVEEANAAIQVAEELGLVDPDQDGTVIYYDLEAYNTNDSACRIASNNFIIGWTERMEAKGNIAGIYGSYYSGLVDIASHPTVVPDAVWIAHWIHDTYDSTATVWDAFRLPNSLWPNHQRIRQYTGGHNETWGGLTLNIDSNVMDGITAVRTVFMANDNFEHVTTIPYAPFADNPSIHEATSEPGDPVLPCIGSQGFQSAWYQYTPSVSGRALVSTRGSSYDTALAVWTGTPGSLVVLGCNDDSSGQQSQLQFDAVAGTTYYFEVVAKVLETSGSLFFSFYHPANDDILGALALSAVPARLTINTTGAGDSSDDPAIPGCNLAPGKNSIWFTYSPSISGPISVDSLSSNYDTYLAVWSGIRGSLALVGCNDDADGNQSRLEVALVAGNTYYIEVGQYGGSLTPTAKSVNSSTRKAISGGILNLHLTSFHDVPGTYWGWNWVERLYSSGITTGCGTSPKRYCPEDPVTRAQMAIFLLRGVHGPAYQPPVAIGIFPDVPVQHWASSWIEQLFVEGITTGCGGGNYCPEENVTRAQMAVFLLRSRHGATYLPPAATGTLFADVPGTYWASAWIEQLFTEGITTGCGSGNYCPEEPVKRAEMAVFLTRVFSLP